MRSLCFNPTPSHKIDNPNMIYGSPVEWKADVQVMWQDDIKDVGMVTVTSRTAKQALRLMKRRIAGWLYSQPIKTAFLYFQGNLIQVRADKPVH